MFRRKSSGLLAALVALAALGAGILINPGSFGTSTIAGRAVAATTVKVFNTATANVFTGGTVGYPDRGTAVGSSTVSAALPSQVLGNASLQMVNTAAVGGWEVGNFTNPAVAPGTALGDIDQLEYSTYRASGQAGITVQHISLQFTIDYDTGDAYSGFQGRLVYEPYLCNATPDDTWSTWDTLAGAAAPSASTGCWWQTANPANPARAPYVGNVQQGTLLCPQSDPCTWAEVMAAYPDAGFHATNGATGLIFKAGSTWTGTFYVDALTVEVGATTTIIDFEIDGGIPNTEIVTGPPAKTNNNDVTFTYVGSDPAPSSGIASFVCTLDAVPQVCPLGGSVTLIDVPDGTHTFSIAAVDSGGNTDPTPSTRTFLVDTTKPLVTTTTTPAPNGNGWNNGPVTITFACADTPGGSGITPPPPHGSSSGAGNTYPSSVRVTRQGVSVVSIDSDWRCVDMAGNAANAPVGFPKTVKIDSRDPSCRVAFSPSTAKGSTLVAITTTSSDNSGGSGVASTVLQSVTPLGTTPAGSYSGATLGAPVPQNVTFQGASGRQWKVTLLVTDKAGNTKTCTKTLTGRS